MGGIRNREATVPVRRATEIQRPEDTLSTIERFRDAVAQSARLPLLAGIAVLAAIGAVLEAAPAAGDPWWVWRFAAYVTLGVLTAVTLARPNVPAALPAAGIAALVAWLNYTVVGSLSTVFLPVLVAIAAYDRNRTDALAALGLSLLATLSYLPDNDRSGLLGVAVVVLASFGGVRLLRRQQVLLRQLREAQALLAHEAAVAERRRIAAEIHDVAAHSLAVTMLHLTGARMLVKRLGGDPRVLEALNEAERIGRESMIDMRRSVGLLEGKPGGTAPLPTASDVPRLIADYEAAGLLVAATIDGDLTRVAPSSGLALYRIVQEALANAVRHAPGQRVELRVRIGSDVALEVQNDQPRDGREVREGRDAAGPAGAGLAGMRDRALALGGTFRAGDRDDLWIVSARLPL